VLPEKIPQGNSPSSSDVPFVYFLPGTKEVPDGSGDSDVRREASKARSSRSVEVPPTQPVSEGYQGRFQQLQAATEGADRDHVSETEIASGATGAASKQTGMRAEASTQASAAGQVQRLSLPSAHRPVELTEVLEDIGGTQAGSSCPHPLHQQVLINRSPDQPYLLSLLLFSPFSPSITGLLAPPGKTGEVMRKTRER
jgi:hypothetical protein